MIARSALRLVALSIRRLSVFPSKLVGPGKDILENRENCRAVSRFSPPLGAGEPVRRAAEVSAYTTPCTNFNSHNDPARGRHSAGPAAAAACSASYNATMALVMFTSLTA